MLSGSPGAPASPVSGVEIVSSAIDAAGGAAWVTPSTLQLAGTATFWPRGEASGELHLDHYAMWREYPEHRTSAHRGSGRVRIEGSAGGETFFRVVYDGERTRSYLSEGAKRDREAYAAESNFGFGILRNALDPAFSVRRLADDEVSGHHCRFVRVVDAEGGSTDFGIDADDSAVRWVGFATPRGFHHRVYDEFAFHRDPTFRQPGRVRLYYDGIKHNDISWTSVSVNRPIPDGVFAFDGSD